MNEDMIMMSQKELQRVPVIESVLSREITQLEAARCLELSARQIRRLRRRLQREGPRGLAHRNRGRSSNHRLPQGLRWKALGLIRQRYSDFGPTLACEKLAEFHKIHISNETLRQWMRGAGLWAGRRRLRPHRQWRERSACYGQMAQMDGSHHDWLEGRGPKMVLMGVIDDATGKTYARFYNSEDLPSALDIFQRYCRLHGIPQSVYLDKHTIYRSPKEPTLEEQIEGKDPQSQFERALSELGVHVIHANSPQAKGRVERLFKTLQDRLVKEMRLARVKTLEEANCFLGSFLREHNRRFSKAPREPGNLHRFLQAGMRLDRALCIKKPRVVANDGTIQVDGQRLQLLPQQGLRSLALRGVMVTVSPKGLMRVIYEGRELRYRALPIQSRPAAQSQKMLLARQLRWKGRRPAAAGRPALDHPWRNLRFSRPPVTFSKPDLKPDISILVKSGHF